MLCAAFILIMPLFLVTSKGLSPGNDTSEGGWGFQRERERRENIEGALRVVLCQVQRKSRERVLEMTTGS